MNNEAKERLWNITRRLLDASFAAACDETLTDEEFQKTVDSLTNHLVKVRRRSRESHVARQMA